MTGIHHLAQQKACLTRSGAVVQTEGLGDLCVYPDRLAVS